MRLRLESEPAGAGPVGFKEEADVLECAIPKCHGREKLLRSGTLHLIDSVRKDGSVGKRMVWLCQSCTAKYTVQTWRAPGKQIRPLSPNGAFSAADVFLEGLETQPGDRRASRIKRHGTVHSSESATLSECLSGRRGDLFEPAASPGIE